MRAGLFYVICRLHALPELGGAAKYIFHSQAHINGEIGFTIRYIGKGGAGYSQQPCGIGDAEALFIEDKFFDDDAGMFKFHFTFHKNCLMIINIVYVVCISIYKSENNPVVAVHLHTPIAFIISFERMKIKLAQVIRNGLCQIHYL